MISSAETPATTDQRDCVLVVGGEEIQRAFNELFRREYPLLSIRRCETFLSGIAEAVRTPVRAAIAPVDPLMVHLEGAVAGLREAIGPQAKLILCCTPAHEPVARRVVRNAADDYVLLPLERGDLDRVLDYARPGAPLDRASLAALTPEDLDRLGEVFSAFDRHPSELLEQLAQAVHAAFMATGVTIIVEGAVATAGNTVVHPVLTAPLMRDDGAIIGQLTLAARREGAYSPDDAEKLRHFALFVSRVLALATDHRRLRHLATTDECSGLPNRRFFYERLDHILERAARERFPVTVLIFDIDHFKNYNDRFGHEAGDWILRTVGKVFRRLCREQDVVARLGGDEFAVVFWDPNGPRAPGSEHPEDALAVLDRVRDALRKEPIEQLARRRAKDGWEHQALEESGPSASGELKLTISGGLATFPWDAASRDDLLRRADEALLSAKRSGKNRILLIGERDER